MAVQSTSSVSATAASAPGGVPAAGSVSESGWTRRFGRALMLVWLGVAVPSLLWGLEYYLTPLQERPYSSMHDAFGPAGLVGHGFGIVGSLMILVGVGLYSARKRLRLLARVGALKHWLQVHIFLCTLGPFLVLLHTTFKVGGIVAIAFWSMVVIVASGIFGRYVYVRIPKTINGEFYAPAVVRGRQREVRGAIQRAGGLTAEEAEALVPADGTHDRLGPGRALVDAVRFDLMRRRHLRNVDRRLEERGVAREARDEIHSLVREHVTLTQQLRLMHPFQKLFGYWHVLHLPLALVMLLIMIVHSTVAVVFGYTWIF